MPDPKEIARQILEQPSLQSLRQFAPQIQHQLNAETFKKLLDLVGDVRRRDPKKALKLLPKLEYIAGIIGTEDAKIFTIWQHGNILKQLFLYEESLEKFEQIETYYINKGDILRATAIQINKIGIYRDWGQNRKAVTLSNQARQTCLKLGEPAENYLAVLEMNVAWCLQQMGEPQKALEALYRARTIQVKKDRKLLVAQCDNKIAFTLASLDRFSEAKALFKANRVLFVRENAKKDIVVTDLNLAQINHWQGFYLESLQLLENILASFDKDEKPIRIATINLNRAKVYYDLNLFEDVVNLLEGAKKLFKQENWHREYTHSLMLQGMGYKRLNQYALAKERLDQVRSLMKRDGAFRLLDDVDFERAELAFFIGKIDTAKRIAHRLQKQNEKQDRVSFQARLHLLLAKCYLSLAKLNKATREAQCALSLTQKHHIPELKAQSYFFLGSIAKKADDIFEAEKHYEKAISEIEHIMSTLLLDDIRVSYMATKLQIYQALVDINHQLTSQKIYSSAKLFDILNLAQTAPVKHTYNHESNSDFIHFEEKAQLQSLRQKWHWYQSKLNTPNTLLPLDAPVPRNINISTIQQDQQQIESEIAELMRRQRIRVVDANINSELKQTIFDEDLLSKSQSHLGEDILLHYYLSQDNVHMLAVTATETYHIAQLTTVKSVNRLLRAWRFAGQRGNYHEHSAREHAYLKQFYNLLIQPLLSFLPITFAKVFLILPPIFHELPFEAFYDGSQYLVQKFHVARLSTPEALLSYQTRQLKTLSNKSAHTLIVGYSNDGELPFACQEAKTIGDILGREQNLTELIEDEATVENFQKISPKCGLIHIASHAVFRADNPLFSWIRLADGHITVNDLYAIQFLQEPLVVLSACETGRGMAYGGGLLGIARGFLSAGASSLIVTLWRIIDEYSANFMTRFYETWHLKNEVRDVSHMLRQVQIEAILAEESPLVWASFIVLAG